MTFHSQFQYSFILNSFNRKSLVSPWTWIQGYFIISSWSICSSSGRIIYIYILMYPPGCICSSCSYSVQIDARIMAVRRNRWLRSSEKSRQIRILERERMEQIRWVTDRYSKNNNRYDDRYGKVDKRKW